MSGRMGAKFDEMKYVPGGGVAMTVTLPVPLFADGTTRKRRAVLAT